MTNAQAIQAAILSKPESFGFDSGTLGSRLSVIVDNGSLRSATARISYRIYTSGRKLPILIAQSHPLWRSVSLPIRTPFTPDPPHSESAKDLLPRCHGILLNGNRRIFWAEYVDGTSLTKLLQTQDVEKVLNAIISRLSLPPWHVQGAASYLKATLERYEAFLDHVSEAIPYVSAIQDRLRTFMRDNFGRIRFGFAHGDVWCNDLIIRPDGRLCLIDWEWSDDDYPQGYDLLSLCLSAIEKYYELGMGDSFQCLVEGCGKLEFILRKAFVNFLRSSGYGNEEAFSFLVAFLLRIQFRIIQQQEFSLGENEYRYGELLSYIMRDRLWVTPILK